MSLGPPERPGRPRNEIAEALGRCRAALAGLVIACALINVLYLSGSIYMLEIYDRVLTSRSIPTLVGLSVLVLMLYGFQALLDLLRGRVLVRVGRSIGQSLSGRVYETIARLAVVRREGDGLQPVRDIDQVRGFLSGQGPGALLDLPWMPFYIGICFIFHFWIGMTALIGALIIVAFTAMTEFMTRGPQKAAMEFAGKRHALAESTRRNAEAMQAMGMAPALAGTWARIDDKYLHANQQAADVAGTFGSLSKVMRMALQSALLGVGAYLVIRQEATPGIIIAGSILGARALAPVDLAIANWRGFIGARQSWRRLDELFKKFPLEEPQMALPKPKAHLSVENASVAPPGVQRLVVQDITFRLDKGSGLGIIGPSASGKSSLARLIAGVWPPVRGTVRIDGATLDQWPASVLGQHIGYLPQDVELFAGTISENIARFQPDPDPKAVIAAAAAAGVHEMILRIPGGYEAQIGEGGAALSAGQRQRIALARALYGDPFLVVLDEPNSNLDAEGEEALTEAILGIRARGGIAIVIAHRPSAVASVDQMLVMMQGRCQAFGPKEEVLSKMRRPASPQAGGGLRVVTEPGVA
ncbi:MAG: type I secretion system permease/ATPase [Hyphomicrobiales bacterium]|nr:type I secretion system permease/ATPase [Hyphomicrobiales bacterium]